MSNIDATAMLELHGLKEPEIFGDIRATCARAQPKWSRGGRKIYYGTHRARGRLELLSRDENAND